MENVKASAEGVERRYRHLAWKRRQQHHGEDNSVSKTWRLARQRRGMAWRARGGRHGNRSRRRREAWQKVRAASIS